MSRTSSLFSGPLVYVIAILVGIALTYSFIASRFSQARDASAAPIRFYVEKGWGLQDATKKLEEQGIINSWWATYFLGKFDKDFKAEDGKPPTIFPGEYEVSAAMIPREILKVFIDKKVIYHTVTIPEGYNIKQIAPVFAGTTLTTEREAEQVLVDKAIIAKHRIPANTLEGYIFPETYRFTRPDDATVMVERAIEEGQKRITEDMHRRAAELGFSWHQVLTLASIIEKESAVPAERTLISSVFHNRMRIGMPLQSDPTVIYGIKNFDGNLTREHLNNPGPYNTYLNTGLPPTPIANPGAESIRAALYPEDSDYLYFVAKGEGAHHFSATYNEHRKAVQRYQKDPWKPERAVKSQTGKKVIRKRRAPTKKPVPKPVPFPVPKQDEKPPAVNQLDFE